MDKTCQQCHTDFTITDQDRQFYKSFDVPNPKLCPDCRRTRRIQERGPYHLWSRQCSKCQKTIQTNYSPERADIIYCEQCYQVVMY